MPCGVVACQALGDAQVGRRFGPRKLVSVRLLAASICDRDGYFRSAVVDGASRLKLMNSN